MTVKVVDIITNFAIEIPLHYYIITKVFNYSSWLVSNRLLANTGYDPLVQKRWHKVTFEDRGRQRNGPRVMELHTVQRFLSISLQLEQHWSSGVLSKGGFTPQYLPSSLWRNSVLQLCLKFKGLFKWLAMERKREKMSQKKLSDSIGSQTWVTLCFFLNPSVTRQQLHESAFSLLRVVANSLQTEFTITFLPSRSCIIPIFHHPEPPVESNRMTNDAGNLCRKRRIQPLCSPSSVGCWQPPFTITAVSCGYATRWDVGRGHYLTSSEFNVCYISQFILTLMRLSNGHLHAVFNVLILVYFQIKAALFELCIPYKATNSPKMAASSDVVKLCRHLKKIVKKIQICRGGTMIIRSTCDSESRAKSGSLEQ